jgi:NAD(P)-dependent dehydrogenase (short-subunit alcohol dehydrogenase family)
MSTVVITGAATGIGNLTAKALARAGHRVYATMRAPAGRNAPRAQELHDFAATQGVDLRVLELDVVIHNAGHLLVGYVEAFTAEEIAHLIDVNTLGVQRLNRAALPCLRQRGRGTLLYVGSTVPVTTPPFLGPYVVSKAAMDSLALVTSYEVSRFGIETVIVMPGAFTQGTDHFPKAGRAADVAVAEAYKILDPLVARNEEATASLVTPGTEADPVVVAEEITRLLALPYGERPFRSVVDLTNSKVEQANAAVTQARTDFVRRLGFGEVLELRRG